MLTDVYIFLQFCLHMRSVMLQINEYDDDDDESWCCVVYIWHIYMIHSSNASRQYES